MNGLTPQQYVKVVGRGGSPGPVDKQQGHGPRQRSKQGLTMPSFPPRAGSSPGPGPQGPGLPCPSSLQESVTEKPPLLPQGKARPFVSFYFLLLWEPLPGL